MPRERREHEEHLENVEPVGVVILNDVSYLLQDVSEIVLDLAKLLRNRRADVMAFMEKVKEGPAAISELLPEEFLPFLMGSAGEVAGVAMETKAEEFAAVWRKRLWADPFEHPDAAHRPPSEAELESLDE